MSSITYHYERARAEEYAAKLRADGYLVELPDRGPYDLVASRGGERIAYDVVLRPADENRLAAIREHRVRAKADGFSEYRLVIAGLPQEVEVRIENLEDQLSFILQEAVGALSPAAELDYVQDVTPDRVIVQKDGIRVAGSGSVVVTVLPRDEEAGAEADDCRVLPFEFDLDLDHGMSVRQVHAIDLKPERFWP